MIPQSASPGKLDNLHNVVQSEGRALTTIMKPLLLIVPIREWSTIEHNSHPVLFSPDHSAMTLRRFHLN
jgi:hypothetical protein